MVSYLITKKVVKTCDTLFDEEATHTDESTNQKFIDSESSDQDSPWIFPDVEHKNHQSDGIDSNDDLNEFPDNQLAPEILLNQPPKRNHISPNRFGNLRAYSASLDESATISANKDLWTATMKLEIDNSSNKMC